MRRWIMAWLHSWRDEWFRMSSPLSGKDARRRLYEGFTSTHEFPLRSLVPDSIDVLYVWGRIDDDYDEVTIAASRYARRNSYRLVLRGQLVSTDNGCELVGRLGWDPLTRALTAGWLGVGTLALLILLVTSVYETLVGDFHVALGAGVAALVAAGVLVTFAVVGTMTMRASHAEEDYLRAWLANRLLPQD